MAKASLHGHSYFSDGVGSPEDIVRCAEEQGIDFVGITDHGTMAGTYVCFRGDLKVKVVAGIEAYHLSPLEEDNKNKYYHITLLALNDDGYRNLCEMNYAAWKNKKRFPVMDIIGKYVPGVACLTGCPQSYFASLLRENRIAEGVDWVNKLQKCYDVVCIEIMGGSPVYDEYCYKAMDVARKTGLKPVSTKDYHYCYQSERDVHSLLCFAKGRKPIEGDYSLSSDIETVAGKEGIQNAISIAKTVEYTPIGMQKFDVELDVDLVAYTVDKAKRMGEEYVKRVTYEWDVIKALDMEWYIKTLYKICRQLSEMNILYEARGSASGSLVCYLLGITCIDPIKYGLLFERFMSKNRREIPDIDLDVPASKRGQVLSCLSEKWNVAKLLTLNTIGRKMAERCCQRIKNFANVDASPESITGKVYHVGTHASGIIIWPKDHVPVVPIRHDDGDDIVERTMDNVPYIKWDLLGQKTLDVISDFYVSKTNDKDMELYYRWRDSIIDDKEKVYNSACYVYKTSSVGVFQLEGNMRTMLQRKMFASLDDFSMLIAIYRPAVLASGVASEILDGVPIDPLISDNCRLGYPVFQEDLMNILHKVVGLPLEDTYTIIKLAAKKDKDVLDDIERRISLLLQDEKRKERVISILRAYFGYGFNVAHAVAYAVRMAVTAYMRYVDDKMFMLSLLNRETNPVSRVGYQLYVQNVLRCDISPFVGKGFKISEDGKTLLVGLDNLRHVSDKDADSMSEVGYPLSIADFASKCIQKKVGRKTIQSLDNCGVSRWFWGEGATLLQFYDAILYNQTHKKKKVPVPQDREPVNRSCENHTYSVKENSFYTENAGLLVFTLRIPPVRVLSLRGDNTIVGAVYRQGSVFNFIDGVGEVYELRGLSGDFILKYPAIIRAKVKPTSFLEVVKEK